MGMTSRWARANRNGRHWWTGSLLLRNLSFSGRSVISRRRRLGKNARDYGVYGNGISDDTAALQKALDECDTVYLPQGTYLLSDTLRMREGNSLIGLNPISTQLVLGENSPAWAGMGAPKAVLETSRGGWNLVNGLGIDTASRNPRAVGCKWMASANSYMNDVKFVGGHGQITQQQENVPVYNASRTADVNPDRPWDSQYWSLWITAMGAVL